MFYGLQTNKQHMDSSSSLFTTFVLDGDMMPGIMTSVPKRSTEDWLRMCHTIQTFMRLQTDEFPFGKDVRATFEECRGQCPLIYTYLLGPCVSQPMR